MGGGGAAQVGREKGIVRTAVDGGERWRRAAGHGGGQVMVGHWQVVAGGGGGPSPNSKHGNFHVILPEGCAKKIGQATCSQAQAR